MWRSKTLRLFIIEGPSPMDLLLRRSEASALQTICALIGHEVTVLQAISPDDFAKTCSFIASIDSTYDQQSMRNSPLCIHLAAHGNEEGIAFGPKIIKWTELAAKIRPICTRLKRYDWPVILVISACGAAHQTLTQQLREAYREENSFTPPTYLFITADETPRFPQAAVSWAVFYHHLPEVDLKSKKEVQAILRKVRDAGAASIKYYRWEQNKKKYLHYVPD